MPISRLPTKATRPKQAGGVDATKSYGNAL